MYFHARCESQSLRIFFFLALSLSLSLSLPGTYRACSTLPSLRGCARARKRARGKKGKIVYGRRMTTNTRRLCCRYTRCSFGVEGARGRSVVGQRGRKTERVAGKAWALIGRTRLAPPLSHRTHIHKERRANIRAFTEKRAVLDSHAGSVRAPNRQSPLGRLSSNIIIATSFSGSRSLRDCRKTK